MQWLLNYRNPGPRLIRGLNAGLLVSLVMIGMLQLDLFESLRNRLQDNLYAPAPTSDIVTIVAIDDKSLAALGRSPAQWDRTVHAELIDILVDSGTRVIGFDILFDIPSEEDAAVIEAIQAARQRNTQVVMPVVGTGRALEVDGKLQYESIITPTDDFSRVIRGLGHVNLLPDTNGTVREFPLVITDGEQSFYALGLSTYLTYNLLLPDFVRYEDQELSFPHVDRPGFEPNWHLTTNSDSTVLISYFGSPSDVYDEQSTFATYSYIDVLEGQVPPEAFTDKIVLIGILDAVAQPDSFRTPISLNQQMFGVEIHANIIEMVHQLNQREDAAVTRPQLIDQPVTEKAVVILLVGALGGIILTFLRWHTGFLATGLGIAGFVLLAVYNFDQNGKLLELFFPLLTIGFTYVGALITNYLFEERRRNAINDLFSRYVSPEIARKVVENYDRGKLDLGGEERELTVLFADVRGFTTLAEGLPPAEVVELLNYFLEQMNQIVMNYNGAINKYIGDNLMAFWNAPYPQADHAWLGVQAGLEMQRAIEKINDTQRFKTRVQFGIGINTGEVVVGNIGSQQRLEYTPIGDAVNVASRLSSIAEGGVCLIGEKTYEYVAERVTPQDKEEVLLKGRKQAIQVYRLKP